jgi:multiple sugar transport system permease protein
MGPARGRLFLFLPLLLLLVPFLLWPVVAGLVASFTTATPFQSRPHFIGVENFTAVISDGYFRAAFRTVAVYTLVTATAELALGLGVALLLREPVAGRGALRVLLLLPWLIGPIAGGVMWHFLFAPDSGIAGAVLGTLGLPPPPSPLGINGLALPAAMLAEIWQKAPLVAFLLYPGVLSLPPSLSDQAVLDGASAPGRLWHIVLPWLRPLLLAVSLLVVGGALGAFDGVLMLTGGGPGARTLTPALYSYRAAFQSNNWSRGATSAWLIAFAVILVGAGYLLVVRREDET